MTKTRLYITFGYLLVALGLLLWSATYAMAVETEPGATFFEDGSCQEADGTPGTSMIDGECMTIADYDYLFSFENLNSIQSLTQPELTIAEEAGITDADNPASERPLGAGLVEEPFTFASHVRYLHGLPVRLA